MLSTLSPGLLVSAPSIQSDYFKHTVILLIEHDEDGSFGVVLNKPADVSMREVLDEVGCDSENFVGGDRSVFRGGPVSPETGWIIYDGLGVDEPESGSTLRVGDRLRCSASLELLQRIAANSGPERFRMALGYAGWSAGQLERELAEGSWIAIDVSEDFIFETSPETQWLEAYRSLGIEPAMVVRNSGGVA